MRFSSLPFNACLRAGLPRIKLHSMSKGTQFKSFCGKSCFTMLSQPHIPAPHTTNWIPQRASRGELTAESGWQTVALKSSLLQGLVFQQEGMMHKAWSKHHLMSHIHDNLSSLPLFPLFTYVSNLLHQHKLQRLKHLPSTEVDESPTIFQG